MEHNEMAAKRRKKRKKSFCYAPFAPFCGHQIGAISSPCHGFLSNLSYIPPIIPPPSLPPSVAQFLCGWPRCIPSLPYH